MADDDKKRRRSFHLCDSFNSPAPALVVDDDGDNRRPSTPSAIPATQNKIRWGELEEDDGEDLDFLLPPRQVIGPDENGIKKVIEYKFDEDGNKVKITTTTRTRKLTNARLSKRAIERRSWAKFGDFVHEDVGSRLTMVSTEEILLERPRAPGSKAEEPKAVGDPLAQFQKGGGAVLMVCRTCGKKGDHWTSRCPYKDLAPPAEGFVDKPAAAEAATAASGSKAYVPPGLRGGVQDRSGSDMRRRNDENSVRVTNLSEDTREPDLLELFRPFGAMSRVYVAVDQKTGMSRGFGFVNFVNREDAQRAINKLNGYGYDNLVLRVEWATPRTN
ncbi:hypothetical protein L6164_019313 [Bauhinia variegata]|uniref:Uncharacterized protein n=1 Tax=Bauhinia variegata TaxID=167791 RepID=A0ACB9MSX9_BAUVA|nr:hypothetical protein L6164_019313 [Bauhinia variegata]